MSENIFFDTNKLKKVGKNVIIGKTVRIRYPELVEIGDNCIIDDFTYISTELKLGNNIHIAPGVNIIGGRSVKVTIDSFSGLSSNSMLIAGADDYISGFAGANIPIEYKNNMRFGDINVGKHCFLSPYSCILPGVTLAEGTILDNYSRVSNDTNEWLIYKGDPAKPVLPRNKNKILELEQQFLKDKE